MKAIFLCQNKDSLRKVYAEHFAILTQEEGVDPVVYTLQDVLDAPARFADTTYIFSTWGMPVMTEEQIAACFPKLECVFYGAGTVQTFARPFLARGVKVFSAWAANAVPVVEYTLAQIILANKGFLPHCREMKQGNLAAGPQLRATFPGNYGQKVGIIGAGMIGAQVAQRLKDFRLEVLAYDPFLSEAKAEAVGVRKVSLDELFTTCQVVTNHMANNAQTQGMLTYEYFSKMPPYATFINTGRGAQVVEADLVRILGERPDLTAVLDVTYPEPPMPGHPFYTLPNCFLSPHIAGSLENETHRMAEYIIEEYHRYTGGLPCKYEVTPTMLETMA